MIPPDPYAAEKERIIRWVDLHGPDLLHVARSFAADQLGAEDILQETWIVLLAQIERLPSEENAGGWLHGIVLNVGRSSLRNSKNRRRLLDEQKDRLPSLETQQSPIEARILASEVWRAIGDLPSLQKDVVLARLIDGMSTEQTARAIGRKEGTVKASFHRAVKRLKKRFGSSVDEALDAIGAIDQEQL